MGFFDTLLDAVVPGAGTAVDVASQAYDAVSNLPALPDVPDDGSDVASSGGSGGAGADRDVIDSRSNLGVYPMPNAPDFSIQAGDLVAQASQAIGKRLSAANIVRFVVKYGWQVASAAFRLSAPQLAYVVASQRARPQRRRGPHLYTVLKRIRTGRRYEKMLAKVAAKVPRHGGGRRRLAKNATIVQFRRKAK